MTSDDGHLRGECEEFVGKLLEEDDVDLLREGVPGARSGAHRDRGQLRDRRRYLGAGFVSQSSRGLRGAGRASVRGSSRCEGSLANGSSARLARSMLTSRERERRRRGSSPL
jgi:hypothetical protein